MNGTVNGAANGTVKGAASGAANGTVNGTALKVRSWLAFCRLQARAVTVYRADYALGLAGLIIQIYLFRVVWVAVYGEHRTVHGVTLPLQIAYSTIVSLQSWVFMPRASEQIPQRVREGTVAMDLLRPLGFLHQVIACQVGGTAVLLPFALVGLPFAVLAGGAVGPASALAAGEYVIALLVGWAVATLLQAVVGMLAFWTLEVSGPFMIYTAISQFLAGALVPLWFMPEWLRETASVLPFQASSYAPVAIYLGRVQGSGAWVLIGQQVGWAVVVWVILRLVWRRVFRRVTIQGG